MAVSEYDKKYLDEDELKLIEGYTEKYGSGKISDTDLHDLSESLRKRHGYSGGADGTQYIQLDKAKSGGSNVHMTTPFQGTWSDKLQKTANEALSMKYEDFLGSDLYKALANKYTGQGQKAMSDVLGEVSARTGGMASSYATAAAGETYNGYMEKLADAAREMYESERQSKRSDLEMLRGLDSDEYGRYMDDRNFGYQLDRDRISDERYEDETTYSRLRDQLSDERYEDETTYSRLRDQLSDERYKTKEAEEKASAEKKEAQSVVESILAENGGDLTSINPSILQTTGWSEDMLSSIAAIYRLKAENTTKSGSAGSTGKSSTGSTGKSDSTPTEKFFKAMKDSGNPELYAEMHAKDLGITTASGRIALLSAYKEWENAEQNVKENAEKGGEEDSASSATFGLANDVDEEKGYIFIRGYGTITFAKLAELVEKGEIEEVYNPKNNTYSYYKS